jgi:tetratricopeptide (TPR) repeat protein
MQVAEVLREVRDDISHEVAETPAGAVFTVPASFGERQRSALREAAIEAGWGPLRILEEPLAAVMTSRFRPEVRCVLVFSLGASVCGASLVRVGGGSREALWHEGSRELGGNDFDAVLIGLVMDRLGLSWADLLEGEESALRLRRLVEQVKLGLSKRPVEEFEIHLRDYFREEQVVGNHFHRTLRITREELEQRISPYIDQAVAFSLRAVEHAELRPDHVHAVLLVGGSTRIPLVEKRLRGLFGAEVTRASEAAIATGAALYGAQLGAEVWNPPEAKPESNLPKPLAASPGPPPLPSPAERAEGNWGEAFAEVFNKAQQAWRGGDHNLAVRLAEEGVNEATQLLSRLHFAHAQAMLKDEQYDNALANVERSLRYDPRNQDAYNLKHRCYNRKARALWGAGRFEEAREAIRQSLKLIPDCRGCRELASMIQQSIDVRRTRPDDSSDRPGFRRRRR